VRLDRGRAGAPGRHHAHRAGVGSHAALLGAAERLGPRMSRRPATAAGRLVTPGFFVLRTPLLPFSEFTAWGAGAAARDRATLRERLRRIICRPEVREAVRVASPPPQQGIATWIGDPETAPGQRIQRALVRDPSRITRRRTPR